MVQKWLTQILYQYAYRMTNYFTNIILWLNKQMCNSLLIIYIAFKYLIIFHLNV